MTQINMKEKTSVEMLCEKKIKVDQNLRWTVVGVVGLLGLALVIGATVVGIYVGKNMTQDVYEEAWATYHNTDTDTVLKQRYIMDGKEVSIIKPGEFSVILDFDKNQAVMQVDGIHVKATNDCLCFVYDIDPTDFMSLGDVANMIHTGNIEEKGSFPTKQSVLELSEQQLELNDLSKRSVEMCHGCKLMQATLNDATEAPCPIVTGGCDFRNAESVVYNAGLWCKTEAGHHQDDGVSKRKRRLDCGALSRYFSNYRNTRDYGESWVTTEQQTSIGCYES